MIVPTDLQEEAIEAPPRVHGAVISGGPLPRPRVLPEDADLDRAAAVLNAGEKVAVLAGAGARGAAAELEALADRLGCGVAKALNGRDVLPDDLPWVTGAIGLLGTAPSDDMIEHCDTLLMIGSGFPYSEWLPEPGSARGVQIDIDATMLGIRYPMEVNLVGDARARRCARCCRGWSARPTAAGRRASPKGSSAGGGCWESAASCPPSR